jgi:hypothetical protein
MPFKDPKKREEYEAARKQRYADDPAYRERVRVRQAEYNEKNREKIAERRRTYYKGNASKCKESAKRSKDKNQEYYRKYALEYAAKNRERKREYDRERREKLKYRTRHARKISRISSRTKNPVLYLLRQVKSSAAEKELEFSIRERDIFIPSSCPYLNIPILMDGHKRNLPSVDRINNKLGYTPGNVEVISWRANELKRDATLDELIAIGRRAAALKAQS